MPLNSEGCIWNRYFQLSTMINTSHTHNHELGQEHFMTKKIKIT